MVLLRLDLTLAPSEEAEMSEHLNLACGIFELKGSVQPNYRNIFSHLGLVVFRYSDIFGFTYTDLEICVTGTPAAIPNTMEVH